MRRHCTTCEADFDPDPRCLFCGRFTAPGPLSLNPNERAKILAALDRANLLAHGYTLPISQVAF